MARKTRRSTSAVHAIVPQLLGELNPRIGDVRAGPDRSLYVLTEAGALLRLEPAP